MQELTAHEKALLDLLRKNPFAAQSELATALGVARSTVAAQLTDLSGRGHILGRGYILPEQREVVCIGGAAINRKYYAKGGVLAATSNPCTSNSNFGGVARNVAESLACLATRVKLVSVLGDDDAGHTILQYMTSLGVDVSQTEVTKDVVTAEYVAILDEHNELHLGMAAMDAFDAITPGKLEKAWSHIASGSWVFADCNLPAETLQLLLERKTAARFNLAIDTVSIPKACRLPEDLSSISVLFTNIEEARAILQLNNDAPEDLIQHLKARGVKHIILTLGAEGHLVGTPRGLFKTSSLITRPVDVTGAGDALVSGTLYGLVNGMEIEQASRLGALLSTLTIESELDVLPDLSPDLLDTHRDRLDKIKTKRLVSQ